MKKNTDRQSDSSGQRPPREIESFALAEYIVEHCPSAVVLSRVADDRIVFESLLAQQLIDCPVSRKGEELVKQWSSRRDYAAFKAKFLASGSVEGVEVRMQRNQGQQFWCSVAARMVEVGGEEMMFIGMTDLTSQLADKAEITRQRDALHDAEKLSALGELLAGISHELNNPLSVVMGQALMLKEKAPDDATGARADKILKSADRASRIVRSFLDLARQQPSQPVVIDLNEIVIDVLDSTGDVIRESNIDVVLETQKSLPRVVADPDQVRQVVVNLLVNAQQALDDVDYGRVISIRTRHASEAGNVLIRVSDNGPGIPSEISSRVFEPLFTTKPPGKGTGLGLALCRRIVETNKGSIELESSSARGTTFVVTFPESSEPPPVEDWPRRLGQKAPGKLDILVVDEDADLGMQLSEMLIEEGHGVEVVESEYVGLERVRKRAFGALFCRAGASGSSIRSFLRSIDEMRPGTVGKLVFVVARDVDREVIAALDQFERPYLMEPLREREVREVTELLSLRAVN